jgi:prephenate dehydrogenase
MDAVQHDRLMAFLSHLPQLTASALMDVIGTAAGGDGLPLAGRGLVDTTRLASSPPDTWRDVCATNEEAIGQALDALIARLTELRHGLHSSATVDRVFRDAARWRVELMKGRE